MASELSLGERWKLGRHIKGLTLQQLSQLAGVSASHLARIERGERSPSLVIAQKISKALGSPALGTSGDTFFEEIRARYGLASKLVEGIKTVETTQEGKPLQVFPNPNPDRSYYIKWETSELTSLCPKTGQPDFCNLTVEYIPDKVCLELKSAKLYLWSYRQEGHFYEDLINLIYQDFHKVLEPKYLKLIGKFAVRGGFVEEVIVESKAPIFGYWP